MNRVFGKISEFALVRQDASCTVIGYDFKPEKDGENATWCEAVINNVERLNPSFSEIKKAVIGNIDRQTKDRIINGFDYQVKSGQHKGTVVNVWLSLENQQNFCDLRDSADSITFPIRYKIGEDEEENEIFEFFQNKEEIHDFCCWITQFIHQCQEEGWAMKGSIDWAPYKALFPEPDQTVNENS